MTDTWDVAQYVESHPEDSKQRWRLAKKYFQEWEFRLALEHLLLLKNEWPDNLNVHRYVAATYYRLERYDDSVLALKDSIEQWPRDVSLYEQLAKAYQGWGKPLEASEVWAEVAAIDPSHRFASRAAKHMLQDAKDEAGGDQSQTPVPAPPLEAPQADSPVRSCPECGTKNGPEFERCWQCHAELSPTAEPDGTSAPLLRVENDSNYLPVLGGIAVVALLTLGLYLTLLHFLDASTTLLSLDRFSLHSALSERLRPMQVVAGVVLLAAWPIAVHIGTALLAEEVEIPMGRIIVAGLLPASLTYALSWLLPEHLWVPLLGGLATALALSLWGLGLRPKIAVGVWTAQFVLIAMAMATVAAAMQGFSFLTQWPTVYEVGLDARGRERATISGQTPATMSVEWSGSGSSWLDAAGPFGIQIESGALSQEIYVSLNDAQGATAFFRVLPSGTSVDAMQEIVPGERYTLEVSGDSDVAFTVTLEGPLEATIASVEDGALVEGGGVSQ